jgi:hypothetical protein
MNDWDSDEHLARAADLPDMGDLVHTRLLETTTRVIRARRRRRVAMQLAAVILAFISGMLTMAQLPSPSTKSTPSTSSTTSTTIASEMPTDTIESDPPATQIYADPEALARAYDAAAPEERLRLLRGAGDYELNDRGDVRSALAYYEQWVRLADDTARKQYNEEDTWLLASLKQGD